MYGLVLLGVLIVVLLYGNGRLFKTVLCTCSIFVSVLLPVPHVGFNAFAVFGRSNNTWCVRVCVLTHAATVNAVLASCASILPCRGNAGGLAFMRLVTALVFVYVAHALVKVFAIVIAGSVRLWFIFAKIRVFCVSLFLLLLCDGCFPLLRSAWGFPNIIILIGVFFLLFPCRVVKAHGFAWRACSSRRNNSVPAANSNISARVLGVSFAWKVHCILAVAIAWSVWLLCRNDLWRNHRFYLMVFVHHIIFNRLQNVLVNLHCA